MGILHLVFVLLNFRTLGRLYARINQQFPGVIDQLWEQQSFARKIDVVFGFSVFAKRAMLMNFAVMNPDKLPIYLLGDDQIALHVRNLNNGMSARTYRFFCAVTGFRWRDAVPVQCEIALVCVLLEWV
ncbi:hypothetical protein [Leisingera sp. ANG-M6]|uniref:hypothetical protein n=1 Tax=Leisingera sp. ANG-M6 TaxID=1577900 RepID=UPI00057F5DB8|nr:hypothetical protein [Leisingera sp. ANG-M6]KIC27790.1 hypothetical protein RA24_13945 [Leisingera sp. ANG-M6]